MKMKLFALLILLVLSSTLNGQVHGVVFDALTGEPLPDVHIKQNGKLEAVTDANGRFELSDPTGKFIFRHVGFETTSRIFDRPDVTVEIQMHPLVRLLDEAMISASKELKNISLIPQILAPDSLTSATLAANPFYGLNSLPSVYFNRGTRNTQKLTIRGLGARSQYSTTKIKAFVNGFPVTSTSGEVFLNDMTWTTFDRMEVVPGPVSNEYGSSFGGFLFLDIDLPDEPKSELRSGLMVGDFGYMHQYNSFRFGSADVKGVISYQSMNDNGFRQNDAFDGSDVNALVEVRLSETATLQSFTLRNTFKAFIPSSLSESDFLNHPEKAADSWNASNGFEEDMEIMQGLSLQKSYSKDFSQTLMVFGKKYEGTERRPFNTLEDNTKSFGARTTLSYRNPLPVGVLNFHTGLNFRYDNYRWKTLETLENDTSGELLSDNRQRKSDGDFFLFADYKHPVYSVKAGLNAAVTNYTTRDLIQGEESGSFDMGVFLSPYLKAKADLTSEFSAGVLLSRGSTAPSFEEAIDSDGGVSDLLLPENGWQRELGLIYKSKSNRFLISSSVFYNSVMNQIITKRITEEQFIKINAGESSFFGVEARLSHLLINEDQLTSRLGLSYAWSDFSFDDFTDDGVILDGNRIPGISKHKASLVLSGKVFNRFSYRADLLVNGELPMNDQNTKYYDGYEVLNLTLSYHQKISERFDINLTAMADNLLNQSYASMILVNAPSFGGADPRWYYPGAPRSLRFGFELNYNLNIL